MKTASVSFCTRYFVLHNDLSLVFCCCIGKKDHHRDQTISLQGKLIIPPLIHSLINLYLDFNIKTKFIITISKFRFVFRKSGNIRSFSTFNDNFLNFIKKTFFFFFFIKCYLHFRFHLSKLKNNFNAHFVFLI